MILLIPDIEDDPIEEVEVEKIPKRGFFKFKDEDFQHFFWISYDLASSNPLEITHFGGTPDLPN